MRKHLIFALLTAATLTWGNTCAAENQPELPGSSPSIRKATLGQIYRYAREMYRSGKYPEAITAFKEMLSVDCNNEIAQYHLMKIARSSPKYDDLNVYLKGLPCKLHNFEEEDFLPSSLYYETDVSLMQEQLGYYNKRYRIAKDSLANAADNYSKLTKELEEEIESLRTKLDNTPATAKPNQLTPSSEQQPKETPAAASVIQETAPKATATETVTTKPALANAAETKEITLKAQVASNAPVAAIKSEPITEPAVAQNVTAKAAEAKAAPVTETINAKAPTAEPVAVKDAVVNAVEVKQAVPEAKATTVAANVLTTAAAASENSLTNQDKQADAQRQSAMSLTDQTIADLKSQLAEERVRHQDEIIRLRQGMTDSEQKAALQAKDAEMAAKDQELNSLQQKFESIQVKLRDIEKAVRDKNAAIKALKKEVNESTPATENTVAGKKDDAKAQNKN